MPSYDASQADCFVFTFKEGLLSSVAHDLRLRVTRFSIEVDDARSSVLAHFDTDSLCVDAPMKDGSENPSALSEADKLKIAAQIRDEVLHSARYPRATFRGTRVTPRNDGGYDLNGELLLHGVARQVTAQTSLVAGRQQLELSLHQPDFGIVPFRAMLGSLKIKPAVLVRVIV